MTNLKSTASLVRTILEEDERARNSDSFLYLKVLDQIGEEKGICIDEITVPTFLLSMKELGFPAFETVRRTRQLAQEHFPELASNERVSAFRGAKELEYRAFVRGDY